MLLPADPSAVSDATDNSTADAGLIGLNVKISSSMLDEVVGLEFDAPTNIVPSWLIR